MTKSKYGGVRLGQTIRDMATGFTGVATARVELLNGNVQFSVYPKAKPDAEKYPDGVNVDLNLCEVVDDILVDRVVEPPEDLPYFELGSMVRDKLNGFQGVAVRRNVFLSGCVYYSVEGRSTSAGAKSWAEEAYLPAQRLELAPVADLDVTRLESTRRQLRTATGGPSAPVQRQR